MSQIERGLYAISKRNDRSARAGNGRSAQSIRKTGRLRRLVRSPVPRGVGARRFRRRIPTSFTLRVAPIPGESGSRARIPFLAEID
jgi:hypothetical protein